MDTEKRIPVNIIENAGEPHLANLTDNERSIINNYVLLTRDVVEANQLFDCFYFTLQNLRTCLTLNSNDTIIRTEHCPHYGSDFIAINSLVISYISSAKTLTEFLRAVSKEWVKNNISNMFNTYCSKKYDKNYTYRLLTNLRNIMQHGYLPVSFNNNRYSFDVHQILHAPHFHFNGLLKTDMENFIAKLDKPGDKIANLALTYSLAEFTVEVIDIYKCFISCLKSAVQDSFNNLEKLIKDKPSILCDYHKDFNGFIFYSIENRELKAVDTNEDPNSMMTSIEKKISNIYSKEKHIFDELQKFFVFSNDSI